MNVKPAVCVVVCDKENKITDESGTFSLRMNLKDTLEKNSNEDAASGEGIRIQFQFSCTTDKLESYKDSTVVYKKIYEHSLFNTLKKFSSKYEEGWISEYEKATLIDAAEEVSDDAFKIKTIDRWQQEFGTGNLLFYLVFPGCGVERSNWILYGKAPYRVSE